MYTYVEESATAIIDGCYFRLFERGNKAVVAHSCMLQRSLHQQLIHSIHNVHGTLNLTVNLSLQCFESSLPEMLPTMPYSPPHKYDETPLCLGSTRSDCQP
jgi:hypothetical protein